MNITLDQVSKDSDWSAFAREDPFNNNFVEGYISHHSGDEYGALFITKVNREKVPQLIFTTPKILYPFDKNGNWHFPKAKQILRYEKLDGTNIFAYSYVSATGKKFVSYKTRLLPFVGESRFGPFLSMWKEILARYPEIPQFVLRHFNMSFELWGARNPHLVKYEVPLQASLLFTRSKGKIEPPLASIDVLSNLYHFPQALFLGMVDKDYVYNYKQSQAAAEATLRETEDGYLGSEGEVWYLLDETGMWNLYKCKPSTIEAIHWSSGGIGKNVVEATIENAFENWDEPSIENIKQLLLEEFSVSEVEKIHYSIETQLRRAITHHQFVLRVLDEYKSLGISILDKKTEVLRALSGRFAKSEMKKVYSVIWAHSTK